MEEMHTGAAEAHPPEVAPARGDSAAGRLEVEEDVLDILFAANVQEDWEGLEELAFYLSRRKPQLVILTSVLRNPLTAEEQVAYRHALRYLTESFQKDGNFSNIQLFLESFRHDPSTDIVSVSARRILGLIETGKGRVGESLRRLAGALARCPCPWYLVPGRFEDVDMVRAVGPAGLADRCLTVRKVEENGFKLLGIGGLPGLSPDCPAVFQDREYIDGTSGAEEYLEDVVGDDVDVLVSHAPIRHFTDPGEEEQARDWLSRRLPGRIILTSQPLGDFQKTHLTAARAELIRGGRFGRPEGEGSGPSRTFWELLVGRNGLTDKSLFELKAKKAFRML